MLRRSPILKGKKFVGKYGKYLITSNRKTVGAFSKRGIDSRFRVVDATTVGTGDIVTVIHFRTINSRVKMKIGHDEETAKHFVEMCRTSPKTRLEGILKLIDWGIHLGCHFYVCESFHGCFDIKTFGLLKKLEKNASLFPSFAKQIGVGLKNLLRMGIIPRCLNHKNVFVISSFEISENGDIENVLFAKLGFCTSFLKVGNVNDHFPVDKIYKETPYPPVDAGGKIWGKSLESSHIDKMVGIWCLGALFYIFLTGKHPYKNLKDKFEQWKTNERHYIVSGSYSSTLNKQRIEKELKYEREKDVFSDGEREWLPSKIRNLIQRMLEKDPKKRMSYDEFFSHPLVGIKIDNPLEKEDLRERIEFLREEDKEKIMSGSTTLRVSVLKSGVVIKVSKSILCL